MSLRFTSILAKYAFCRIGSMVLVLIICTWLSFAFIDFDFDIADTSKIIQISLIALQKRPISLILITLQNVIYCSIIQQKQILLFE